MDRNPRPFQERRVRHPKNQMSMEWYSSAVCRSSENNQRLGHPQTSLLSPGFRPNSFAKIVTTHWPAIFVWRDRYCSSSTRRLRPLISGPE